MADLALVAVGAAIAAGFVSVLQLWHERKGTIEMERLARHLEWRPGEFLIEARQFPNIKHGSAQDGAEKSKSTLSLETICKKFESIGVKNYKVDHDNKTVVFGITRDGPPEQRVAFRAVLDADGGLSLMSYDPDVSVDVVSCEAAVRLLELNSENKIGMIGIQRRDKGDRFWVDHYMNLDDALPSDRAIATTIYAVLLVHAELREVLAPIPS